jgi:hypothetical protein
LVGTTGICDFVCVAAYFVLVDSDWFVLSDGVQLQRTVSSIVHDCNLVVLMYDTSRHCMYYDYVLNWVCVLYQIASWFLFKKKYWLNLNFRFFKKLIYCNKFQAFMVWLFATSALYLDFWCFLSLQMTNAFCMSPIRLYGIVLN